MGSCDWWAALKPFQIFPEKFIDFAIKLLNIPASSAAIERNFSALNDIMTKKRNQLGVEKAGQLCGIYRVLSRKVPKDSCNIEKESD